METNNSGNKGQEKSRSGSFPTVTLLSAVDLIKRGADAGWSMSKETFAKATGGTTANSGAFFLKLAALRDYGLIERGAKVEYTQLAKDIVAPKTESEAELKLKLKDAFLSSEIFGALYEKIKGGTGESSVLTIANIGVHDFRISVIKKDVFAKNFVLSAEYAGLIESPIDGKIKVIEESAPVEDVAGQKNVANASNNKKGSYEGFVFSDAGLSWNLTITTLKPINSQVRKILVDIAELLDNNMG